MSKRKLGKVFQRVLAFVLSVAIVLGGIPITAKADASNVNNKVTDPSTLHDWEKYFNEGSTEFAGAVWTDKSVFESADEFEASLGNTAMNIQMKDEANFMIALSALASNKEIVGYSTIPTDTILILDVSQSMDSSQSVPQMVRSANEAIQKLQELNKNNRVGVVLYSGNPDFGTSETDTGIELLPLGRYKANVRNQFVTSSSNSTGRDDPNGTQVSIASGLQTEGGQSVRQRSKVTEGGTYIQNGLDIAMDEFLSVDPVIDAGNVQAGTKRMPIFVLMSDGAPTTGTRNYTNIGESTVGNGGATAAGLGFMTQLTAAYARTRVETHYGTEAKFYTLGLNLSDQDEDDKLIATSVLDPANSINAITTYWSQLFQNGRTSFYAPGTSNRSNNPNISVTVNRNTNDGLTVDSQNYVTKYFPASGNEGLSSAFVDIVNEIILQSAYYPTLIGGSNTELDGYITFEDEIGQFMEVKNITGLMLGDNQLFTGAALTKMMETSEFGDRYSYTELGWELVESVAERIGVSQEAAIELLKQAWADGQLSYTSDTNFSNYIGWYESADGKYVAYWNEDHTEADIPQNAKYITRSYGFYGKANVGAVESLGSDMMHIVVKVRTEITTQNQDVVFMIPAALIPVITYHVELDTDDFATATQFKMYTEEQKPIRLLFEVGLRSDINELNITEKLAHENLVAGQHIHRNDDGTYTFYTNQWGSGDENKDIDYSNPSEHLVAESHFHPNEANERYYYVTDTVIYQKTGADTYTKYTGAAKPTGDGFYHPLRIFAQTNAVTKAAKMTDDFLPVSSEVLTKNAKPSTDGSGTWYIEKGTMYQNLDRFPDETLKSANNTGTLRYFDYPVVAHPDNDSDTYDIWTYLGNNGRMTVTPATGIKLTKLVDETVTDAEAVFKFTIELTGGNYDGTYRYVDANGTYGTICFTNGKSSVIEMKANETIYVIDLPVGANYTVTETNENTDYKVDSVSVDGQRINGVTASGKIESMELAKVTFTNTERLYEDLIISKTVTHDFGNSYVIPADKKFDVEVTLGLANGTKVETSAGTKTVTNGKIAFQLAHDESVTLYDLLEGTTYSVTEVNIPKGFTLKTTDLSGKIGDGTAEIDLVNDYNPTGFAPTAEIDINVTKQLKDVNGNDVEWNGRSYKFYLQKQEGNNWVNVPNAEGTASKGNTTFTVKIPENYLKEVGTYVFRIQEDANNLQEGIVSDTAVYFAVIVTDKDMDGSLEVGEIRVNNAPVTDKENVNLTFTNTYVVTGSLVAPVPIKKTLINNTGVELLPSGFEFALYEGANRVSDIVKTNANGDATIYMTYTSDWFNNQTKVGGKVEKIYTLKEIAGNKAGMTYTKAEYTVKVLIGLENNKLKLEDLTIINANQSPVDTAVFENKYELAATRFDVSGAKNLEGRGIGNDKYTFRLYKTGSDFDIAKGREVDAAENNGTTFALADEKVETAGVHYYVIVEEEGNIPGISYDKTRYHLTVVVKDNGRGGLSIVANDISIVKVGVGAVSQVVFNNVYTASPTGIVLTGAKVLNGKGLEHNMFEFVLKEGTKEISRAYSSANGTITFPQIRYTEAKQHVYTISEVNAGKRGFTYDDSVFTVTVDVTDNGLGQLIANVTNVVETDGADAEDTTDRTVVFRNWYVPDAVTISLEARKLLENRHLKNHEFTFQLFEADKDFNYGRTPLETVHNDAQGKIKVEQRLTKADTYYFVMKEDVSSQAVDIVYDETEYQITVVVYDQGGYLGYHATYTVEGRNVDTIAFSNVFVPQDPVQKDVYAEGKEDISIDGTAVKAGDILVYEIDYTNFTNQTQNGLTITDKIPVGTTYVEGSASQEGFVSYQNGTLTWKLDDIEAGEIVVVTFKVKVNEGKAAIENKAHVAIGNNEYDTNVVTNYTFDKEVDKTEVKIGEVVTYTISYKNTEKETANVKITDKLAEGLTYVDGSATNGGVYNEKTHTITWEIKNVAALVDGEVSFKATVNEKAVKVINNVASIQVGNNAEVKVDTDTVETKIYKPELETVKKQAVNGGEAGTSVLKVKKGDKVTYYITVTNNGNLAAEGVVITDKVPAGLQIDESSISNKGVLKDGVITWDVGEVKANESVTLQFTVEVVEYNTNMSFKNIVQTTYENDPTDPGEPDDSNEVTTEYTPEGAPQTGDASAAGLWSSIAISSLLICAVLLLNEKKRRTE